MVRTSIVGLFLLALTYTLHAGRALSVAVLCANMVESNIVTPKVLEHWLELNAVISLVGVLFFWLLFGAAGALLAVPILVAFKILCEHIESLKPAAAFLGK